MFSITCTPTWCTVHKVRDRLHMSCRQGPLAVIMSVARLMAGQTIFVRAETPEERDTPVLLCTSCQDPNHGVGASHEMYL